jgi:tRNA threonylcarbamoyladenosine modification (KEOPS) complex  Pcc1 subunit
VIAVRLELKIAYPSVKIARTVFKALEPDNTGHIGSRIDGKELFFTITADNAGTLRNAADDLLACVKIAQETSGLSDAVPDLDGDALPE